MKNNPTTKSAAFSLTEVLSVVGIIGILSALAIPNVSRVNDSAKEATAKRNAQNLASVCISAQSAGLKFIPENRDLATTVSNIVAGGHVSGGTFDGSYFGLPSISPSEQESAMRFLIIRHGSIVYNPHGSSQRDDVVSTPAMDPNLLPIGPRRQVDYPGGVAPAELIAKTPDSYEVYTPTVSSGVILDEPLMTATAAPSPIQPPSQMTSPGYSLSQPTEDQNKTESLSPLDPSLHPGLATTDMQDGEPTPETMKTQLIAAEIDSFLLSPISSSFAAPLYSAPAPQPVEYFIEPIESASVPLQSVETISSDTNLLSTTATKE